MAYLSLRDETSAFAFKASCEITTLVTMTRLAIPAPVCGTVVESSRSAYDRKYGRQVASVVDNNNER